MAQIFVAFSEKLNFNSVWNGMQLKIFVSPVFHYHFKKCLNYFPKTLIWAAQSLDLVAEHTKIAKMWVEVLTHIIQATKSVEMQREHEG